MSTSYLISKNTEIYIYTHIYIYIYVYIYMLELIESI